MQWTVFALLGSARQAEVQALVRLEGISTNKEQLLFHLTERVWVYLVCKGPRSIPIEKLTSSQSILRRILACDQESSTRSDWQKKLP